MKSSSLWLQRSSEAVEENFLQKYGILLGQVLWSRGLRAEKEIDFFLNPRLDSILPPDRLKDLSKAAGRLAQAIKNQESICVYGDYDMDGMCGLALLYSFFKKCGAGKLIRYQPDRLNEGYGVHVSAIEDIHKRGAKVIVTVDTGIAAHDAAIRAGELGLDLIVTDHHQQIGDVPQAFAVVNPNRKDDHSSLGYLSGAGVAFYLCLELRKLLRSEGFFEQRNISEPDVRLWLDLFALATVADCVDLVGENRPLVRAGLAQLLRTERPGLAELIRRSLNSAQSISVRDISFSIAPKLNAASRLGYAHLSLDLLLEEDAAKAHDLVNRIFQLNDERSQIQAKVFEEAYLQAEAQVKENNPPVVVVNGDWHEGVLGIVASKLVERLGRPAVVLTKTGEELLRGSMRSKTYFSCVKALSSCTHLLDRYGGHKMAAGLQLTPKKLEDFTNQLWSSANIFLEQITDAANMDSLFFDGALPPFLSIEDVERLQLMAPFGYGNPEPLFLIRGLKISQAQVLKGQHLKWQRSDGPDVIGFFKQEEVKLLIDKGVEELEALVVPEVNRFQRSRNLQLRLQHVRPSHSSSVSTDLRV